MINLKTFCENYTQNIVIYQDGNLIATKHAEEKAPEWFIYFEIDKVSDDHGAIRLDVYQCDLTDEDLDQIDRIFGLTTKMIEVMTGKSKEEIDPSDIDLLADKIGDFLTNIGYKVRMSWHDGHEIHKIWKTNREFRMEEK